MAQDNLKKPRARKIKKVSVNSFEYQAIDKRGKRVQGEITAPTLQQARAMIQTQGMNILNIKKKGPNFLIFFEKNVSSLEITLFTRQMATMLVAGIPLVQSLNIVTEGAPGTPLGKLAQKIRLDVEGGSALSIALRKNPKYFDTLYCSLVESGEQSGTLDTMLGRIAIYKEKIDSLKRKIKKALYYPAAVIVVAVIVTTVLLVKVIPTFKELFGGFGAKLPAFTLVVLNLSDIVIQHGVKIFSALFAFIFFIFKLHKKSITFRHITEKISLKMPIFGPLIKKSIVARFARTLATTTAAGVPLTDALLAVSTACGNIVYSRAIDQISDGIAMGQQMRFAMKRTGVFPMLVVQMIGIGEESGALENMLSKIASIFEEEVDTAVDGLTTLLEPIIMVILGVIIGGLVVAMYLPIFQLGSVI